MNIWNIILLVSTVQTATAEKQFYTWDVPQKIRIMDTVAVMEGNREVIATRKLSPSLVMRAIASQLLKWRSNAIAFYTERRYEMIVRQWELDLQYAYANNSYTSLVAVYGNVDYESTQQELFYYMGLPRLISNVLLLSSKNVHKFLKDIQMRKRQNNMSPLYTHRTIIVGNCLPQRIREPIVLHVMRAIIVHMDTRSWLNGIAKNDNIPIYMPYRISEKSWGTLPIKSISSRNLLQDRRSEKNFARLRNIDVHASVIVLDKFVELKNGVLTGLLGRIVTHIQEHLQFTPKYLQILDNYGEPLYFAKTDLFIGIFYIWEPNEYGYMPPIVYDSMTLFAAKVHVPMSLQAVISIFQSNVWMYLTILVLLCNICLFSALHASPSLKHNPRRGKNNTTTRILGLVSCDSIVKLNFEWNQGPNVSTRCLLVTLNLLSLMISNFYFTFFSVRVLQDRSVYPFTHISEICNYSQPYPELVNSADPMTIDHLTDESEISTECLGELTVASPKTSTTIFGGVISGHKIALAADLFGTSQTGQYRNVSKLQNTRKHPSSMLTLPDFAFFELISNMILRLNENGVIPALRNRYINSNAGDATPQIRRMTFSETWYMFTVLAISATGSFVILALEMSTQLKK